VGVEVSVWEDYKKAVGSVLLRVECNGQDKLSLVTNAGTLLMVADGDCCSRSWFESFDSDAEGGTITSFDEYYGKEWDDPDLDCVKQYFGTVYTTKGRVTYELRNSSNGYYGGSVNWHWYADKKEE